MEKGRSELMMLCSQSASELRNLRAEADDKEKLQEHLQWLEKAKVISEIQDEEKRSNCTGQDKKVPRPMNSFMVFSHLERKRLAEENPELHNADLSKILGSKWKSLTPAQRQPYIDEAERLRVLHTETYPEYKYKPRRRKNPKRSTKKFSTLTANDVTQKTKLALNLDCSLPPVANHPLSAKIDAKRCLTPSASPAEASPVTTQGDFDAFFDNSAIPPTPSDSPLMSPDVREAEVKANMKLRQDVNTNYYSFLPPTPELSPLVTTSVTRGAFNFDPIPSSENVLKSETVETVYTTYILPRSVCSTNQLEGTTNREQFDATSGVVLPLITTFVPAYTPPDETPALPQTSREEGALFGDVDRDEFDQYLGTTLEKSHLSNSLRNIIAELEDNFKK